MQEITKEQFGDWKANPVTVAVMEQLDERKALLASVLCDGGTVGSKVDETALNTARHVGVIEGLNQILNIEFIDGAPDA